MTQIHALRESERTHSRAAWSAAPADKRGPASATAREAIHVIDPAEEAWRLLSGQFAEAGIVLWTYSDVDAFLATPRADAPSCLVIDVRLLDLPAALECMTARHTVVVAADRADVAMAVLAMKTGAVDFVEKPICRPDIVKVIGAAIETDRGRRAVLSRHAELRARFDALSPREKQVMALVTAGKMNKQVAGDLGLSEITVKAYRGSAMRKMSARSLAEWVRMADLLAGAPYPLGTPNSLAA